MTEEPSYDAQAWDRAWRYFELHAGQRMMMFNFFVVLSGLITAGVGTTMQGPPRLAILGILLGLLLMLLSFVFWKLDQRAAFLVKHSEAASVEIERQLLPPAARLFSSEPASFRATTAGRSVSAPWTFGRSLRIAFAGMALIGAAAAVICGLRAGGTISWEAPKDPVAPPPPPPPPPHPPPPRGGRGGGRRPMTGTALGGATQIRDINDANTSRSRLSVSLRSIRSQRVRNLMRGILAAESEVAAKRTLERLRGEASPVDAAIAFDILQSVPEAHQLPLPKAFPVSCQDVDRAPFYSAAPIEIEVSEQGLRFAREAERLVAAIQQVAALNESILDNDHEAASGHFARYRESFGISFLVAQKAFSLRHSGGTTGDRRSLHGDVIAPFLSPRRQTIAVAFEDSIDEERDYTRVRRTFLKFVAKGQLDSFDAAIISDLFAPHLAEGVGPAQRIQAYGRWGALDCLAATYRIRRLFELGGHRDGAAAIDAIIPHEVGNAWQEAFTNIDILRLQACIGIKDQFFDRSLFSHLPAWSEYKELFDYRLRVETAVSERLDGRFPVTAKRAGAMAAPRVRVDELLARGKPRLSLSEIDPATSGGFHRTIALVASQEAGGFGEVDGERLSTLLDQTIDVASMFSRDELAQLLPRRREDHLYEFLRTAVVNDQEESKVSNHALRRSLQQAVISRFDGDIVKLLEYVDTERHHVSKHLYNLCTEAFLTELYDLFDEADQVTEAHANILEWWGARANDEDAQLRAKSHRLTLRLRKVRGAIEETRIYVDPLRFIAWIGETMTGELRTLAVQANLILDDSDRSINLKDRVRVAVQPRMKLIELLDRCYEEFCTNKLYGVTSFIGRRIRHGTLHGHLVLEFKPEIDSAIAEFRHSVPRFAAFLENWFARFDAAVQVMAADRIHVRSKEKTRGLIVATLDEPEKTQTANRMVEEVAKSMAERPQLALSAALIHEYCWLLFEADLKRTREAVEELRREFVINVDDHLFERGDMDRRVSERIRRINSAMQQKFEIVRSWFTRPTNQSPSASVGLLFEAVRDEVRQRFPDFKPLIDVTGNSEVDLIGHRFHFFYDALFILVGNAAKHARSDGALGIDIASDFSEQKYNYVSVSVKSDLACATRNADLAGIEAAMAAEIGDAMMRNKNSGIRKLREMVGDVEEIIGFDRCYEGDSVIFTIDMRYLKA
ncbi:hypothetical protein NKI38_26315 [Mesorhizobium sp. M0621]|uniref:hypothetical protein n=1 Tax=Mesorhizobium sp. M0621 TaxID=2956974 RepID=UPI00333933A2